MLVVTLWWQHGLDGSALTGSRDYGSAPPSSAFHGLARFLLIGLGLAALIGFSAVAMWALLALFASEASLPLPS